MQLLGFKQLLDVLLYLLWTSKLPNWHIMKKTSCAPVAHDHMTRVKSPPIAYYFDARSFVHVQSVRQSGFNVIYNIFVSPPSFFHRPPVSDDVVSENELIQIIFLICPVQSPGLALWAWPILSLAQAHLMAWSGPSMGLATRKWFSGCQYSVTVILYITALSPEPVYHVMMSISPVYYHLNQYIICISYYQYVTSIHISVIHQYIMWTSNIWW